MCGIVGILNQSDEQIVMKMVQSVAHRGPDGLDSLITQYGSLGASRLAIMGNPNASAIFYDAETNVEVMLNGEIYNIEALRQDLAADGCVFHTDLESEVISKLYKREGLDFATQLKGMFAIAILDGDQLVLARDRFGIKPLYYAKIGQRVLFGSEIKAILAHPEFKAKLYLPALEETNVFGYIHSLDRTFFDGITQVEPGTVVAFCEDK
jgi:asparagine synthase (glutamine-hydrolysing)